MDMVWHNHEGVQFKSMLASITLEHIEHQSWRRLELKERAAISRHRRDEISANVLRCEFHFRQNRDSGPKGPALRVTSIHGPEGPRSLRHGMERFEDPSLYISLF